MGARGGDNTGSPCLKHVNFNEPKCELVDDIIFEAAGPNMQR